MTRYVDIIEDPSERTQRAFAEFVRGELRARGWTVNDLASRTTYNRSSIQRIFTPPDNKIVSSDIVIDCARAMHIHPLTMLVKAGRIKPEPQQTTQERELLLNWRQLPAEHQRMVSEMTRFLMTQNDELFS